MPVNPFVFLEDDGSVAGGETAIFKLLGRINGFTPTFYQENGWVGFDKDGKVWGNMGKCF